MPPIDPTPHGGEVMHKRPEDKKVPQPEEAGNGQPESAPNPRDTPADIRRRPPLPVEAEIMAADIEDEEDDPVIDTGPGIADGSGTRRPSKG